MTFALGFVWMGYCFGYILGPDPAMNGVFGAGQTCNTAGCHTGSPLNAAGGSLTLSGLPAEWTPGQMYPLTVTIQRTNAKVYGFQLSAVADATNQQAGTLASGGPGVQIMCGRGTAAQSTQIVSCSTAGAIQYAEHANAIVVRTTYTVNWTAPSSAAVGTVRFNVAGNAANGDSTNQGDFIYTSVAKVDPANVGPPPDLSTKAFTMVDRGGVSMVTDGSGDFSAGYARIQPNGGNTTPSGVAIFGFRQAGTLVGEAGVPASPLLTSARIYGEVSSNGIVNTGFAIANPNDQAATIDFHFTDNLGVDFGAGTLTLAPREQKAQFMNQPPFNVLAGRNPFMGTLSFTSNVAVSVIALRQFYNERAVPDALTTTLPITNLSAAAASGPIFLPHFADGGGWTTQIVLVNPTDATITGKVEFWGQGQAAPAAPLTITASGQTGTSFNYSIPRQASFKLVTPGLLPSYLSGSVRVTPSTGASPSSLVIFSYKPAGITLSEAGVPGVQGSAFRMYAEVTALGGVGAVQSSFAIANLGATAATVNLELTNLDGSSFGQSASVSVPANGQIAQYLHETFPGLPLPFRGILRISGGGAAGLSVVGLRLRNNERGDVLVTTTPPTNEGSAASGAELLFPHLANGLGGGGAYAMQFILFSGTAGQASSGNLKFFRQDGSPFNLTVN
jgi:hypothetical protein